MLQLRSTCSYCRRPNHHHKNNNNTANELRHPRRGVTTGRYIMRFGIWSSIHFHNQVQNVSRNGSPGDKGLYASLCIIRSTMYNVGLPRRANPRGPATGRTADNKTKKCAPNPPILTKTVVTNKFSLCPGHLPTPPQFRLPPHSPPFLPSFLHASSTTFTPAIR